MSNESETRDAQSDEPFEEIFEENKTPIMLGLFDVLGFSKRLETEGLENTVSLYNNLISTTVKKEAGWCPRFVNDGTGKYFPALIDLNVRYAYFSDTILLWHPLEKLYAAPFISYCATFVCEALAMGVPVRGAIALGEAVMHRPTGTYIGQPIVDAARLEQVQQWIGVSFARSATWPPFLAVLDPQLIIEYDAPVKEGKTLLKSPVVLDWPRRWRELYGSSLAEKLLAMNEATPHEYYGETIKFIEYSKINENWFERTAEEMKGAKLRMSNQG
jgi:hypothetical protein